MFLRETGVDNLLRARKAVVDTYHNDGYYNEAMLDKVLNGEQDDTFVIRAVLQALENLEIELNLRAA